MRIVRGEEKKGVIRLRTTVDTRRTYKGGKLPSAESHGRRAAKGGNGGRTATYKKNPSQGRHLGNHS